jgi:hypothetical protein
MSVGYDSASIHNKRLWGGHYSQLTSQSIDMDRRLVNNFAFFDDLDR